MTFQSLKENNNPQIWIQEIKIVDYLIIGTTIRIGREMLCLPYVGFFLSTTSTNFDISINLSCIFSIIKIKSNKLSTTKESGIMPGSMGFMNLWHFDKVRGLRQRLSNLFSLFRLVAKSVSLMIFIQLRKSRVGFNFEPMRRYG